MKKAGYLALSALVVLSAVPAISVQPATKNKAGMTLQQYIKTHDKIEVEYRYPGMKLAAKPSEVAPQSVKVKLPAGTPVVLQITDTLSSNALVQGANIAFKVVRDVQVDGTTLIRAGQMGQAQVVAADKRTYIGQPGKITISDFSVRAIDSSYVPLSGTLNQEGKDKTVMSGALSIFICPAFLLMKGGDALFPAGMEKTVYTNADVEVTLK